MEPSVKRRYLAYSKGQTLIEFAFAVPLLLLFLVGIVYFGQLFYFKQSLLLAAQETARYISRIPNLNDPNVRDAARGFTTAGQNLGNSSVLAAILGASNLLSNGHTGDLPPGMHVYILPWEDPGDNAGFTLSAGTIGVRVDYQFTFLSQPFGVTPVGNLNSALELQTSFDGSPVHFLNLPLSEQACVVPEVYSALN